MEVRTVTVNIAPDGSVKLPADIRREWGNPRELGITRVGTSLVLAPVPEKWTQLGGRVIYYENRMIVRDPKIMFGTPVIAGTRIPVRTIVGYSKSGQSIEQIRDEFPFLTSEQIRAALHFQKRSSRSARKRA